MEMEASDEIIDLVVRKLTVENDFPLASYQPKFLIDQVRAACKFEGVAPQFRPDLVEMALGNLFTKDSPGFRGGAELPSGEGFTPPPVDTAMLRSLRGAA
jgi:hypothetical protein